MSSYIHIMVSEINKLSIKDKHIHFFKTAEKRFYNSDKIPNQNKEDIKIFTDELKLQSGSDLNWSYMRVRYSILKKICEDFFPNKVLLDLKYEDIKHFRLDLQNDIFKKEDGGIYKKEYKSKFTKILKEYFKHMLTKQEYDTLVFSGRGQKDILASMVKRNDSTHDQPYLLYSEIKQILDGISKIQDKFYLSALFDGGFRINEFKSIKKKHVYFKKDEVNNPYYQFDVYYSTKTGEFRPVVLSMFNPIFELYFQFIEEYYLKTKGREMTDEDAIFPFTEQYCNRVIKKYVKNILNKEDYHLFHNHSLRHSSATHFANYVDINDADLYFRYGWSLQSVEARTYVKQIKIKKSNIVKRIRSSSVDLETQHLQKQLQDQQTQISEMQEVITELDKQWAINQSIIDLLSGKELSPQFNKLLSDSGIKIVRDSSIK